MTTVARRFFIADWRQYFVFPAGSEQARTHVLKALFRKIGSPILIGGWLGLSAKGHDNTNPEVSVGFRDLSLVNALATGYCGGG
jgi:hypothetical protein